MSSSVIAKAQRTRTNMTLQAAHAHLARLDCGSSTDPNARVIVSSTSSRRGDIIGSFRCFECFLVGIAGRASEVAGPSIASILRSRMRLLPLLFATELDFADPPGLRWTYRLIHLSLPSGVTGRPSFKTVEDLAAAKDISGFEILSFSRNCSPRATPPQRHRGCSPGTTSPQRPQ